MSGDDKRIILALSPSRTYRENTIRMMREIQKDPDLRVIVICVNQPAAFLSEYYQKNGIDTSRIFFINAITQYATGTAPAPLENCRFRKAILPKKNNSTKKTKTVMAPGSRQSGIYLSVHGSQTLPPCPLRSFP